MVSILFIGIIALIPLQNDMAALAVRAPEKQPVVYPCKQFLDCQKARREEKVQEIVSGHAAQERVFSQLSERQSKQQQDQRDNNFRIFLVEVVLKLREFDFHTVPALEGKMIAHDKRKAPDFSGAYCHGRLRILTICNAVLHMQAAPKRSSTINKALA